MTNSIEEITNRWDTTGLLDNLNEDQKAECALLLNRIAQILLKDCPLKENKEEYNKHDELCGIILPAARTIYDKTYVTKKFPNIEFLVQDCKEFLIAHKELYDDLKSCSSHPLIAEKDMCEIYVDDFIKRMYEA